LAGLDRVILVVDNRYRIKPFHLKYFKRLHGGRLKRFSIRVTGETIEIGMLEQDVEPSIIRYIEEHLGGIIEKRRVGVQKGNPLQAYINLAGRQRYWEAHEVLEDLWSSERKPLLQGLIQVAAAQAKAQEGRLKPALRILNRARMLYGIEEILDPACLIRETIRTYITGKSNVLRCIRRL